jgi:fatty acid desaturase
LGALAWYRVEATPWALLAIVVLAAWYMSLQHELVHGHPTGYAWLNRALGLLPIAVWYPFDIYRNSHLAHHRDEVLTYPGQDPESNYLDPVDFAQHSAPARFLLVAQRTALGRFGISPAFAIFHLLRPLVSASYWRNARLRWTWGQHALLLVLMLWAINRFTGISPGLYLALSYLCLGLAFMRSFYEHRPAADPQHRIVINEAGWFWRMLFLNNNFHAVHHAQPKLPWYRIPAVYRENQEYFLERNGRYLLTGYLAFLARYAVRPLDAPGQQTRNLPTQAHSAHD